jgi:hypothetical protein
MSMNEAEWLACNSGQRMLGWLCERAATSDRKLRLFAVACCRRVIHLPFDQRTRAAIELAEQMCDTRVEPAVLSATWEAATRAGEEAWQARPAAARPGEISPARLAYGIGEEILGDADSAAREACHLERPYGRPEPPHLAVLLHDIFGNPFRAVTMGITIEPGWLTWRDRTIQRLAQAAYDERDLPVGNLQTVRLAVLADALEEAGCTKQEMLAHLRGPGPHVRGCWVIDYLLEKQ